MSATETSETAVTGQDAVVASRVDRRWLIALGVVVGLAVLFLVVNSVLLGGGGDDEAVVVPEATTTPEAGEPPVDDLVLPGREGPDRVDPKPPPVQALGARDPFSQLVSAGTTDGTSTPTDGTSATPTDGTGTMPTTTTPPPPLDLTTPTQPPSDDTTTPPPGDDTAVATGPPTHTSPDGSVVKLIDIYKDPTGARRALLNVDGAGHEPAEGDRFAGRYTATEITRGCTTVRDADDGGDTFELCFRRGLTK
ncbi:hypothetical protein BH20ACT9_BH20ACT9_10780 [soil metagenome]